MRKGGLGSITEENEEWLPLPNIPKFQLFDVQKTPRYFQKKLATDYIQMYE